MFADVRRGGFGDVPGNGIGDVTRDEFGVGT